MTKPERALYRLGKREIEKRAREVDAGPVITADDPCSRCNGRGRLWPRGWWRNPLGLTCPYCGGSGNEKMMAGWWRSDDGAWNAPVKWTSTTTTDDLLSDD